MRPHKIACLVILIGLPVLASQADELIAPSDAMIRSESYLEQAEESNAAELAPGLLLRAQEKVNEARAAHLIASEEDASEDDEEYIYAVKLAREAEADARLALAATQAAENEAQAALVHKTIETLSAEMRDMADLMLEDTE